MLRFLLKFILFVFFATFTFGQSIYKPKGCSASSGPNVSKYVLEHPQDRHHLIIIEWAKLEPSPGVFSFTALQKQINTVKSYNRKYALAIVGGGTGSPDWLINTLHVPYVDFLFRNTTPYRLPLWWNDVVQQRIDLMVQALGNELASDTSLALVYVMQMTANGIEGHLNGIDMPTMYDKGFTHDIWIEAAKKTAYSFCNAFPNKAIAFEVHDVDKTATIPTVIIDDLYNDSSLCQRVGAAIWWLSGNTTYQSDLLTFLEHFKGDKYAQLIGKSDEPERFKDGIINSAFMQAKLLGVRYLEPWVFEYQNNTIDSLLSDFNSWSDSLFVNKNKCPFEMTGVKDLSTENEISIYPNPVDNGGSFIIQGGADKLSKVQIFNVLGRVVLSASISVNNEIDISSLVNGIYFLRLESHPNKPLKLIVE